MPITHLLIALSVVLIWGLNFIFVKLALGEISPLLLCAIRFLLASVPAIFFLERPKVSFKLVILYGLLTFGLQFGLLFLGMRAGMTTGLTSVLMQVQVFFSIFFAVIFLNEVPNFWQLLGAVISFTGIALVGEHFDKDSVTLLGFILIIMASASWGLGNLVTKKLSHVNILALIAWSSFIAFPPLLILSLIFEGGPQNIVSTYHHLTWTGAGSVLYIVYASTWIGYGAWNWLVHRYPIAMVAPFTLLVPVFAMVFSMLILGEALLPWKLTVACLVMGGLAINLLGARLSQRLKLQASH